MALIHVIVNIYVYILNIYYNSIVLNSYKNTVRNNIIFTYSSECSNKLVKYLSQFGNKEEYHLLLDSTLTFDDQKSEIDKSINKIKTSQIIIQPLTIYNFITDETISKYINKVYNDNIKSVNSNIIHYGVDRFDIYNDLEKYENSLIANEFLNPNNDNNNDMSEMIGDLTVPFIPVTPINPINGVFMNKYYNSEIMMYEMLNMLMTVYKRYKHEIDSSQVLFEILNKEMYYAKMTFGLLQNMRLLSTIMICEIIKDTTTNVYILRNVTDIKVKYNIVPVAQIQGQPSNITCNVKLNNQIIKSDGIYMVMSFYGNNERGYLESHKLISILAAIDHLNNNVFIFIYLLGFNDGKTSYSNIYRCCFK